MALSATPTATILEGYAAQYLPPVISPQERDWLEIWALVVLLKNSGGTDYTGAVRTLEQDASTLTKGMSVEEIKSALVGTFCTEANVVDSTNMPAGGSLAGVSNQLKKIPLVITRCEDKYWRSKMLLRYHLLRISAA